MSYASPFDHRDLLVSNAPCVSKEAREIDQVRTKIVRPAKADETLNDVRPLLERLVRGEEYVTGSKMIAYENVGRTIGKSASWVRKFVGRHEVGLQHFEWLNLVHAYTALCERIEAAAANERRRAEHLRRSADAPLERPARLVAGQEGTDRR